MFISSQQADFRAWNYKLVFYTIFLQLHRKHQEAKATSNITYSKEQKQSRLYDADKFKPFTIF